MKILLLVFFLLFNLIIKADWNLINGIPVIPGNQRTLVVDGDNFYFSGDVAGIIKSSNGGFNWTYISGPNIYDVLSVTKNNGILYATVNGVEYQTFYQSSNDGQTWNSIQPSLLRYYAVKIRNDNENNLWCSIPFGNGFYIYKPATNSWDSALTGVSNVTTSDIKGSVIVSHNCWPFPKIHYSTNNGLNWASNDCSLQCSNDLAIGQNCIFLANYLGIYRSTNFGQDWQQVFYKEAYSVEVINNNIFVGTNDGVWISVNNGLAWHDFGNNQLDSIDILELSHNSNYLLGIGKHRYNGSWNGQVINRSLNEIIGIQQISNQIPNKYLLKQNYPNPFNPTTSIEFSLPEKSFVKLKIFDIAGKQITELVNENLTVGNYKVDFDASTHSSGVYFYTLETEKFSETKRMVLIK